MTFPLSIENPILIKELRTRMRGAKAFWILLTYLGLLSLILGGTYFAWWRTQTDYNGGSHAYQMGRMFYALVFAVQATLVGLITPALTSGALSIEREQRTFEALAVSPLSRREIVLGKLTSAVAFVGLLLMASLPLVSLCFLLGGVSPQEVATAYLLLLASAFLYGAAGIAYSSFVKTTSGATVLTYGTILVLFLGTLPLAVSGINFETASVTSSYYSPFLMAVNPVGAMVAGGLTETYFGVALPAWLTALSVNLLLGTILTVVALHRIEYPRSDRTPLLRSLTAAFVSLIACYGFGHDASTSYLIPLYALLFVPLFVAGDSLPDGSLRRSFLRLKNGNPVSGLAFVTLLLLPITLLATGTLPSAWLPATLITASALFGFGTLTLLLSQKLKNRWGVMALSFAIIATIYFLPFGAEVAIGQKHNFVINSLYLSPIASSAGILNYLSDDGYALVWGPNVMPWVNIAFTSLVGLVSLGLLRRARKS